MLYDPKWDRQAETKADPFSLGTLVAWLETMPADNWYEYGCNGTCLLARYFVAQGFERPRIGGWTFSHGPDNERIRCDLPDDFGDIAHRLPRTFGAALERTRAALTSTHTTD